HREVIGIEGHASELGRAHDQARGRPAKVSDAHTMQLTVKGRVARAELGGPMLGGITDVARRRARIPIARKGGAGPGCAGEIVAVAAGAEAGTQGEKTGERQWGADHGVQYWRRGWSAWRVPRGVCTSRATRKRRMDVGSWPSSTRPTAKPVNRHSVSASRHSRRS